MSLSWDADRPCRIGGTLAPDRYRTTHRGGRVVSVHRAAYEEAYGPIPAGMFVCHRCDVPACAEPTHLYLGTNRQNMRDASRTGRLERTTETRALLARAGRGKHLSAATRAAISAAKTGTRRSRAERRRIGAGLRRAYAEGRR